MGFDVSCILQRKRFCEKKFSEFENDLVKRTVIGHDVWIGTKAVIKSGVKIGNGAVIGMGSVITKDVGNYEIWAGNPAKFIRKRFNDTIITELLTLEWWNFDEHKLRRLSDYIKNPEKFINEVKEI